MMKTTMSTWKAVAATALLLTGLGLGQLANAGLATQQQMGALGIFSGSGTPIAFATDGINLWTNTWTGSAYQWVNHGQPLGGPNGASVGFGSTTIISSGSTYPVTFIGADPSIGGIYVLDYGLTHGPTWTWAGVSSAFPALPIGATNLLSGGVNYPRVFFSNGSALEVVGWTGSAWLLQDFLTPPGGFNFGVGALTIANGSNWYPSGYYVGTDGNLWDRHWTGSAWASTNHGKPSASVSISSAVGATIISSGSRPFIFVKGSDGNLWSRNVTSGAWNWFNHGKPSGVTIGAAMGATCANSCSAPYAYVKGSDGNLWEMAWIGSAWTWTNHSKPSGVTIVSSVGATAVSNSRPYVYLTGSDGNMWLLDWSGSAWVWSNLSHP